MVDEITDEDIKRVLIDRDITTFKQAFCRIICAETRNKLSGGQGETTTTTFTPSQLFLRNRLQGYLSGKELQFGRQLIQSEDDNIFNRTVNMILHELVNDGTIIQQQEATPDYPIEKYQTTQKLDVICKEFRDAGLPY
jgi:hypothetical protein